MVTLVKNERRTRLELSSGVPLGHVASVDADRIAVALAGAGAGGRVAVSDLVAIPTGSSYLMGLVASVTRSSAESVEMTLMPVGSFDPGAGPNGSFRPGAVRLPYVDAACFASTGSGSARS